MTRLKYKTLLMVGATCGLAVVTGAIAEEFNIPGGDLKAALDNYSRQTGVALVYSGAAVQGVRTSGVRGDLSSDAALVKLLSGTGFSPRRNTNSAITIVRSPSESRADDIQPLQLAQATPPARAVETVTVTSSKLGGADVQSIPIAITALSQEQLTSTQTAGGPDLVKQVPNLTFTKTNFTGYSIQIRGIGTQAISVTTDPAVAVALNDIPFIRNHFFEQEFFDLSQAEVLRGPQGTLYGRNATAGVVNLITAKPTDQFEAMGSADIGNYHNRRFEGMINLPIVDDRLDLRVAGEWTKRDGYSVNALSGQAIDGRNLWSGRVSLGFKPLPNVQVTLMWEHFQENDDRMRSAKQLCKAAPIPTEVGGVQVPIPDQYTNGAFHEPAAYLSQGCLPTSLYSADAFEVPNGFALPFVLALTTTDQISRYINPYANTTQSRDLRVIESSFEPRYKAKSDIVELDTAYQLLPELKLNSETGFGNDFLYSVEDYNRFNTSPGVFTQTNNTYRPGAISPSGVFCDPQLGCTDRMAGEDISEEHAWQLSQEFRLSSDFTGPLNFSFGGNYLHYETEENYYVFLNGLTLIALVPFPCNGVCQSPWVPNVSDNRGCLNGTQQPDPTEPDPGVLHCAYIDPNPLESINGDGHNYFRSYNPYALNSYAGFGEVYYNIAKELKLTGGLRWTADRKHFIRYPSEILIQGRGYPSTGVSDQGWDEATGRFAVNWTPKLDFTDQTLVYGSFAHGYKAGGANPPGAILMTRIGGDVANPIHPLTFAPEFINAWELGSKNTLFDGAVTLNAAAFYYDYKGYQISEIVDRTAINLNFDATVKGAELEAMWEPLPGLKFNFAGGYEDTRLANGSKAVDLMDRTDSANHPDWILVKPYATQASNCIVPTYVAAAAIQFGSDQNPRTSVLCGFAYGAHLDPITLGPYVPNPTVSADGQQLPPFLSNYPGYDPSTAPNNGAGFDKDLSGNELPNAPPFTVSASMDFSRPLSSEWAGTFHLDYYWQDYSWARVFNDKPYDRLRGYTNVNLALIFTNQDGWQVMGYLKNVFDTTAITGAFLNSDDSALTTNVFLTDPRLFGVRVTKNF